ncbi:hypothetical protein FOA52_000271 [Chlamydomonas sp. UWO 241]|nr:hypothetical protein FOA52_000271 [Chlamydomonas sp. UWO 241]
MMAGPGGMGQAEVAVQKLNGSGSSGGGSSSGGGNGGGGGGGFLRAAFGAVAAALRDDSPSASEDEATPWRQQQQQQGAAGGWELVDRQQAQPPGRGAAPRPADRLQCALMSMRLPVDKLARSVLECLAADARAQ